MELLKTMSSPFRKFFSIFTIFTEEIPHEKKDRKDLTALGCLLLQEKLKKKRLLEEQRNQSNQ